MPGPLNGLRVVDCSTGTAAPRATGLMADYGADVVWVEPPGGDPRRKDAVLHSVVNRGKRSIELDMGKPADRGRFKQLLATADVVVDTYTPAEADRVGLGWSELHTQFPALVRTSVAPWGFDGPHADLPPHESLVHALVGTMAEQTGTRPAPVYEGLPFASFGASYLAVIGTMAALYRRAQDGHGRLVETAMVDGALAYLAMMWGDSGDASVSPDIVPGSKRLVARTFCCADGEFIGVHTAAVGAFGRFVRVLGLEDQIPSAEDGTDMMIPLTPEQSKVVLEDLPNLFLSEPRSVWLDRLLEADVCAIPALKACEVFDEPQARNNEMVVIVDDPVLGLVEQVAPAAKFLDFPSVPVRPAPRPGEHTAEVLAELTEGRLTGPAAPIGPLQEDCPPLDGLKVLDLGAYFAGPYSARLLADLGAEVVKLETTVGDQLRGIARPFRSAQAGKRGISLNLKDPELLPALHGLLGQADVVMHNMRPGAAERLGIAVEDVRQLNERAVYVYAPGWGSTGPDRQRQSFAPMLSGYVGASYEVAGQWNDPTLPTGNEDPGNGLLGAVAALIALYARQRSGKGSYVENSQLNATMTHMAHVVRRPDGEVLGAMRLDGAQLGIAPHDRLYETSDGWVSVAVHPEQVEHLAEQLGMDVAADPRFATTAARRENADDLADALAQRFAGGTSAQWVTALGKAGLGCVVPLVRHNNQAFHRDPENQRTGRVAEVRHPVQGVVRELAQLVRVSGSRVAEHQLAPDLGEHNGEVLSKFGYSPEGLQRLRERGSIRGGD